METFKTLGDEEYKIDNSLKLVMMPGEKKFQPYDDCTLSEENNAKQLKITFPGENIVFSQNIIGYEENSEHDPTNCTLLVMQDENGRDYFINPYQETIAGPEFGQTPVPYDYINLENNVLSVIQKGQPDESVMTTSINKIATIDFGRQLPIT